MTTFDDFGLAEPILRALQAEGYSQPTPIQEQAIPLLLEGRDLLGIAQTGTGKTLAFAAPLLNHLRAVHKQRPQRGARVLVLAPTRELAGQIETSFRTYGNFLDTSVTSVFGGVKIGKQIRRLEKGVDVLVATPGRLIDLVEQRALTLKDVEILVLDEADQMLDLGFIHALKRIVPMLPKDRQTLFFSATMPKTIAQLADQFLTDPAKVSVAPESTAAERVAQSAMFVSHAQKQSLLKHVLTTNEIERALVFVRTKHGADRVVRKLMGQGVHALAIHGNKSQPQRQKALDAFKAGECKVMVATEVAARGIDIDGLSHVINYDVPNVPEQYVHRIGRTGRAGAEGIAISFVANDERPYLKDIERLIRMKVDILETPEGLGSVDEPDVKPQFEKRGRGHPRGRDGGRGGQGRGRGEGRGAGRGRPDARRGGKKGVKPEGVSGDKPQRAETGEAAQTKREPAGEMSAVEKLARRMDRDARGPARGHRGGKGKPGAGAGGKPKAKGKAHGKSGKGGGWSPDKPTSGRKHRERPAGGRPEGANGRSRKRHRSMEPA